MTKEQVEEIEELIAKNPETFTPRMMQEIFWCAKHEEEILKMMGVVPCNLEERYRIQYQFLMDGETGLFVAMWYRNTYGKSEDELAKEKKRMKRYMKKNKTDKQAPYDYDLTLEYQTDSFLAWCDDHDCAALLRKNDNDDLLRLSYIAMAIGYLELGAYIAANVNPELLTALESEEDNAKLEKTEEKWIQEFIEKQCEGDRKEELKGNIAANLPRLKEAKPEYSE